MNKIEWCISKHKQTNHYYDTYLPYEFHLKMVHNVFEDFKHLLDDDASYRRSDDDKFTIPEMSLRSACEIACWGHDLIEDARVSYNDCVETLGHLPASIIYAVTNEKGKTRKERANDKYYDGIRNTRGATFIKLCDRIANVQYSKLTKSKMFEMYKNENEMFANQLGNHAYMDLQDYLDGLFA